MNTTALLNDLLRSQRHQMTHSTRLLNVKLYTYVFGIVVCTHNLRKSSEIEVKCFLCVERLHCSNTNTPNTKNTATHRIFIHTQSTKTQIQERICQRLFGCNLAGSSNKAPLIIDRHGDFLGLVFIWRCYFFFC